MQNQNLVNYIISFLSIKEIINLSQTNKKINSMLNNKNNNKVNNLWREECNKHFYLDEELKKSSDEINEYDKGMNIDWKEYFIAFIKYKNIISNEISNDVFNILLVHCYLPKIRKTIPNIESDFSSEHQKHFYDIIREENELYHYYNIYFGKENNENILKNPKLPFGHFLENFQFYSNQIKCNKLDLFVLEKEFNYQNEVNITLNQINSEPLKFVFWLQQIIYFYCQLHLGYIFKYEKDNRRFLNEYINRHNSIIDVALYLNDKYEHINVTMNYLYLDIFNTQNLGRKFSIYNMILSIWYRNVYLILENDINQNLSITFDNMLDEKINLSSISSEHDTTIDSNFISDDEDEEIKDNKSLIECTTNAILDYSIGEFNSNYIKHTDLNINEHYEKCENIIGEKISYMILNKIKNGADFSKLKNVISYQEFYSSSFSLDEEKYLKIIPRTQFNTMKKSIFLIRNYIQEELMEKYIKYIQYYNFEDREMEIEDKNLFESENKKVNEEIKNIKLFLSSLSKGFKIDNQKINTIIDKFLLDDGRKIINLVEQITLFYYEELEKYNNSNKLIESLIKKNMRIFKSSLLVEHSEIGKDERKMDVFFNSENNGITLNH